MNKIVLKLLTKLSTWIGPEPKFMQSIEEMEFLCRNSLFKSFPVHDERRIRLITRLLGTGFIEAFYIINYLHQTLNLSGDVCEFGVAQGRTSALLAHEICNTQKKLWLFDSFEGLPMPSEKDKLKDDIFRLGSIKKYKGKMLSRDTLLKKELKKIAFPTKRTKLIAGFIDKTIVGPDLPCEVCFAYVDFDFYEPILIALNFLDKTMKKGGIIIVDDYDFFSTGVKTAVDEFIQKQEGRFLFFLPVEASGKFCIIQRVS